MVSIGIIGSGAWGTTLGLLLAKKNIPTTLWEHHPQRAVEMQQQRENKVFLPDFPFPSTLQVTSDIEDAVYNKDVLVLVTPSQRMRENVRRLASFVGSKTLLVNASKGIEIDTLKSMTEIISEELPFAHNRIATLSGPNLSREVASEKPTAAVIASINHDVAVQLRDLFTTACFRVYTGDDVVGIELAGALKNIIAIGAGINDGLDYGDNAKAAFITRDLPRLRVWASPLVPIPLHSLAWLVSVTSLQPAPLPSAAINSWDAASLLAKNSHRSSNQHIRSLKASPQQKLRYNWLHAIMLKCLLLNSLR